MSNVAKNTQDYRAKLERMLAASEGQVGYKERVEAIQAEIERSQQDDSLTS